MKNFDYHKKAELPHLRATVYFADMSKLQGIEHWGSAYTMVMGEPKKDMRLDIIVFVKDILKSKEFDLSPIISHEIVHVLQILCEERAMKFEDEVEHCAYIMTYLMNVFNDDLPVKK